MAKKKRTKQTGFQIYALGKYKVYVSPKAVAEFGAPKGPKGQTLKRVR